MLPKMGRRRTKLLQGKKARPRSWRGTWNPKTPCVKTYMSQTGTNIISICLRFRVQDLGIPLRVLRMSSIVYDGKPNGKEHES